MNRDLRIYLLAIALPAIGLVWGGCHLIQSVSAHMDETDRAGLESAAARAAADIRVVIRKEVNRALEPVLNLSKTNDAAAAVQQLEQTCPWVYRAFWSGEGKTAGRRRWHPRQTWRLPMWRVPGKDRSLVVELDTLYVLSRLPGVLREIGVDDPADSSRLATVAEIRQLNDALLLPASETPPKGTIFGEATCEPIFPKWKIRLYRRQGEAAFAVDRLRFRLLGGVALALLVCSLCAGGMVLLRAARKARREAIAKTDFISTMSHEFKTPLTTVSLCAELMQENELDEEERLRAAGAIQREAGRLQRLLQGMLDFSRLESGHRTYAPEPFDLASLARETAAVMRSRSVRAPVVAEGTCWVFADRDAVDQILVNIHDNALKYAGEQPLEISFGPASRLGRQAVELADRGPGLTAEQRRHVFDRFWRADDSTTREQGGSGLGLSIARGLARGMNGDLFVRAREGGGCVFILELPAAPAEEVADG